MGLLSIIWFITMSSHAFFFWFLLLTLILRLHISFQSSKYAMSRRLIVTFSMAMVLLALGAIVFSVCWTFMSIDLNLSYILYSSLFILYAIVCVLAVHFFVSNLSKLTKASVTSARFSTLNVGTIRDVSLTPRQQSISNVSAKYTMLFGVAIITSMVMSVMALTVNYESGLRSVFHVADLCINLWCIYFQFPFAKSHYRVCCGWCDEHVRNCRTRKSKVLVHQRSIDIHRASIQIQKSQSTNTDPGTSTPSFRYE